MGPRRDQEPTIISSTSISRVRRFSAGSIVHTVLPVSLPGIRTVIVFTFALTMHEFVYALAFVSATVAVPVALLDNLFLDRLIAGFTRGAVKG